MHQVLIDNWNKRVQKGDTVYVLGDFSFMKAEDTKLILAQLNGKKILIKGNHDSHAKKMFDMGFDEVHENIFIYLHGKIKHKVYLSHFPYRPNFIDWLKHKLMNGYWDVRYLHKRIVDEGDWLLHGHTHQLGKRKKKMIHVGVDAWNYRPVSHKEILAMIEDE